MCDEMERSVHDSLCVVKRVIESGTVVPGGGAVEASLSIHLEKFAQTLVCGSGSLCPVLYGRCREPIAHVWNVKPLLSTMLSASEKFAQTLVRGRGSVLARCVWLL